MELFLAPVQLKISGIKPIRFVPEFSFYYQQPLIEPQITFNCFYSTTNQISLEDSVPVFSGESFENAVIPYKWQVLQKREQKQLYITFYNHPVLIAASAFINLEEKTIDIHFIPKSNPGELIIDPLFHPLGSLLMVYLAHYTNGLLIHASGVADHNNGYLFTGVSGIGKSTMSKLWEAKGARIINDDRLWLHQVSGRWHLFNTPMMQYAQKPMMAPLSKAFLLRQSKTNELSLNNGYQGALRLMANCIQHHYNKEMTATFLDRILQLTSQVPVYNLGFKPDTVIVDLIRGI